MRRSTNSPVDLGEVIAFYNKALDRSAARLEAEEPAGCRRASVVLDGKGERYAEVYRPNHRRVWVPLRRHSRAGAEGVRRGRGQALLCSTKASTSAGSFAPSSPISAQPGRPQGGSTITQQVAKNLLVGDDVTYERKIREMVVASRLERTLSKDDILELYLNSIYLGRGAWGIELAARSYFGKPAKELTLAEGALLAGLAKGPNYFQSGPPSRPRARTPRCYVLGRMQEDGVITAARSQSALSRRCSRIVAYERPRRDIGFYFVDQIPREAKSRRASKGSAPNPTRCARPSGLICSALPRTALQDGLARYERDDRSRAFPGAGDKSCRGRRSASRPSAAARQAGAGSGRSRRRGCRSMTCTGHRRSWCSPGRKGEGIACRPRGRARAPARDRRRCAARSHAYDVVYVRVAEGGKA